MDCMHFTANVWIVGDTLPSCKFVKAQVYIFLSVMPFSLCNKDIYGPQSFVDCVHLV